MSAHQRYSDEQIREMRELASRGESNEEIAKAYGATVAYVSQVRIGTRRSNAGGPIAPRTRERRKPTDARAFRELRQRVKDLEDAMTLVLRAARGTRPTLSSPRCPSDESPAPTPPPSTSTGGAAS